MKKRRLKIIWLGAGAGGLLSLGMSLALGSNITDPIQNVFGSHYQIQVSLREPAWDGYTFLGDEKEGKIEIGDERYPCGKKAAKEDADLGIFLAGECVGGEVIPKDPTVKNTSAKETVYLGMRVAYKEVKKDGTYSFISREKFESLYGKPDFQLDAWERGSLEGDSNQEFYFYSKKVEAGEQTLPLFQHITISTEQNKKDEGSHFQIEMKAYAVLAADKEKQEAKKEIASMMVS